MLNICVFIFIIYAMSYSVSEILLKRKNGCYNASTNRRTAGRALRKSRLNSNKALVHSLNAKKCIKTLSQNSINKPSKTASYKKRPRTGTKSPVRGLRYAKDLMLKRADYEKCNQP